jgi:hypothetical protein
MLTNPVIAVPPARGGGRLCRRRNPNHQGRERCQYQFSHAEPPRFIEANATAAKSIPAQKQTSRLPVGRISSKRSR